MNRKLVFIANLSAKGSKNQSKDYQCILDAFVDLPHEIEYHECKNLSDLKSILATSIQNGLKEYIVLGGDGSMHHLINELILLQVDLNTIKLGIIPMGTGNDWLKSLNCFSKQEAITAIIRGETRKVDLGKIRFQNFPIRYFINIAGIGFNGAVIQTIHRFKFLGRWAYYAALLNSLIYYKSQRVKLDIDGIVYDEDTFILTIGIGKYAGGGMLLCPNAQIDDGFFEVNLIRGISTMKLVRNIVRLGDGSYLQHLDCISLRAKSIKIIENEFLNAEADGELLDRGVLEFEVLNKILHVYS